jgi:hypothetical protein
VVESTGQARREAWAARQDGGRYMADRVLFLSWAEPVRGKEERAIEVFNEALGILGRKQAEGSIERFEVFLMNPNGELGGFMVVFGSAEQIFALHESEDFRRNTVDAQLCVNGIRHLDGVANEGVAAEMALYQEGIARLPQHA